MRPDQQRVVITGLGAVSGYGPDAGSLARGLATGESVIRFLPGLDEDLPCRIGAAVSADLPEPGFPVVTRAARMAWMAATEAWRNAGLEPGKDAEMLRIHAATGWGPYDFEELRSLALGKGRAGAGFLERTQCGHGEDVLQRVFDPGLGVYSHLSACAASTQAIGRAFYDLRSGRCGICLAGGADSRLHVPGILGYAKLGALAAGYEARPQEACRPFDMKRAGFVVGEGAGFIVMETLAEARSRGAEVLAEVLAASTTTDAFRLTDPDPAGEAAAHCIRECLDRAGLRPGDLDYIQAHGTGTVANDRAESESLKRALGSDAARVPISSLKPYFGHLSMAAGALEVLASVIVLRSQQLPVCLNLDEPEAGCDHAFVRDRNPRGEVKTILKNSFGFGGQNACLVLGKGLS